MFFANAVRLTCRGATKTGYRNWRGDYIVPPSAPACDAASFIPWSRPHAVRIWRLSTRQAPAKWYAVLTYNADHAMVDESDIELSHINI